MEIQSKYIQDKNYMSFRFPGIYSFESYKICVDAMREQCIKYSANLLFCDLTDTEKLFQQEIISSESDRMILAEYVNKKMKDIPELKISVLMHEKDYNRFMEFILKNHHINIKTHFDRKTALQWLLSDSSKD